MSLVVSKMRDTPDITLLELIEEFHLPISEPARCKRLIKLGLTYKKKTFHPKAQQQEDVVRARTEWQEKQKDLDTTNTYWFDESGVNCGTTRFYGRAFSNQRGTGEGLCP